MELNTIFFIGPQGSGKGTQAKLLATKLNFFHWDMGAILRETAQQATQLGAEIKDLIDRGILLSDELLFKVAETKLKTISPENGVIFDGMPRRIGQAEFLMNFLKSQGRNSFITLFLNVVEEETVKRLLLRAQTQGRADDTKEAIQLRLQQYYDDTLPMLGYMKQQGKFIKINGSSKVTIVTQAINEKLGL